MTITIELSPGKDRALLEQAWVSGRDLAGYVHQILQEHLWTPEPESGQDEAADHTNLPIACRAWESGQCGFRGSTDGRCEERHRPEHTSRPRVALPW